MKPIDIVLSLLDSRNDHTAITKKAWENDAEEFFIGLSMASNPDLIFGLDKVPAIDEDDDDPGNFSFSDFYVLAMKLANKELEGDAAKEAVENAAMIANVKEWNLWYRRILLKSLTKYLPMDVIQKELIRLTTG